MRNIKIYYRLSGAAGKRDRTSLNNRPFCFPGPCEPDDFRGSHASRTAVCPSCRDAVYDLKRSSASLPRLSAVCQSAVCRFVFFAPRSMPRIRGPNAHGMEGTCERDIIESYTEHHIHARAIIRPPHRRLMNCGDSERSRFFQRGSEKDDNERVRRGIKGRCRLSGGGRGGGRGKTED